MNLLRTTQTYKTRKNAEQALVKKFGDLSRVRHLIAVNEDGRFAPVLVGVEYLPYAHAGITVVG